MKKDKYSFKLKKDYNYLNSRKRFLNNKFKNHVDYVADGFPKYARRQEVTRFLARVELFKKISNIQGSIVECGVYSGNGIFTWALLSSIHEPIGGILRKIIGFDTFEGFPSVSKKDIKKGNKSLNWKKGDLKIDTFDEIKQAIKIFDKNRFLNQMNKIQVVKGDFLKTSDEFIKRNPHLLVSLLFLDFDLYEPTKKALEVFLPRMSKGSIICFDQINHELWPGETISLLEKFKINRKKIKKFNFEVNMSYMEV